MAISISLLSLCFLTHCLTFPVREPAHVFTLLESVYCTFDRIARAQRVFKVETVGDCYVAVTGFPDLQDDHATRMCRFAGTCLSNFEVLVKRLEVRLGPDTGDLGLRIGIHSGQITAGMDRLCIYASDIFNL